MAVVMELMCNFSFNCYLTLSTLKVFFVLCSLCSPVSKLLVFHSPDTSPHWQRVRRKKGIMRCFLRSNLPKCSLSLSRNCILTSKEIIFRIVLVCLFQYGSYFLFCVFTFLVYLLISYHTNFTLPRVVKCGFHGCRTNKHFKRLSLINSMVS